MNKNKKTNPSNLTPSKEESAALKTALYDFCSRGRPSSILDFPDVERILPSLPATDIYYTIQEIGLNDATDIIALASPSQIQSFLDLDIWTRDRVDLQKGFSWLNALESLTLGPFHRAVKEFDPELVAAMLARSCRIVDLTLEEEPDEPIEGPWRSPDSFYALYPLKEESVEFYRGAARFMDKLYSVNLALGAKTLMTARWEPIAELEESAYRWRSGRLQDFGFADYYESLQVYAPVDLQKLNINEGLPDPKPMSEEKAPSLALEEIQTEQKTDFMGLCLKTMEDPVEIERLGHAMAGTANRLMAADLVESPDLAEAKKYFRTARRYISLGLEYVCRSNPELGAKALGNLTLQKLFRAGYTLTFNLRRLVEELRKNGRLSLAPRSTTLLDHPWDELAAALTQRRPELIRDFDTPPAEGRRPISTTADVRHAASLVEDLAMQWPLLFETLGMNPGVLAGELPASTVPSEPARITLGDLFRTSFLNHLLGRKMTLDPLSTQDLEQARKLIAKHAKTGSTLLEAALQGVKATAKNRPLPQRPDRIVESWVSPMMESKQKPVRVETLTGLVLTKR